MAPGGTPPAGLVRAAADLSGFLAEGTVGLADPDLLAAAGLLASLGSVVRAAELAVLIDLESRGTTSALAGVPTHAWLRSTGGLTPRQAKARLREAVAMVAHPHVAAALASGQASVEQCEGMLAGLTFLDDPDLAALFDAGQADAVEAHLAGHLTQDPDELRKLANHAVEVVAPEVADEIERRRLERAEARARMTRRLGWERDGAGSVYFRAKLPTLEGEELISLVGAHVGAALRRQRDEPADPDRVELSVAQLRADALVAIVDAAQAAGTAPAHGGDRPRITVLLDQATLAGRLGPGVLLDSGEPIPASAWRRAACDADLIPAILGGAGQPLDLGRTVRLVGADLRQALHLRDRGCAFPGCDQPPRHCEGHHITPWAAGGATALDNLVLLCRRHHATVEPDPASTPGSRWEVRMGPDGIPDFVPPHSRNAAGRRPRLRNSRYTLLHPDCTGPPGGADPPSGADPPKSPDSRRSP